MAELYHLLQLFAASFDSCPGLELQSYKGRILVAVLQRWSGRVHVAVERLAEHRWTIDLIWRLVGGCCWEARSEGLGSKRIVGLSHVQCHQAWNEMLKD